MNMNDNSGIGFKIFGLGMLLVCAVVVDLAIIGGGDIFDSLSDLFEEEAMECNYSFYYLDNENYGLMNESNFEEQVVNVENLVDDLENYGVMLMDFDAKDKYNISNCYNTLMFDDSKKYIFLNGIYYDAKGYESILSEFIQHGILSDSLVHFYESETNVYDGNDKPLRTDKELSYLDANKVKEIWNSYKSNYSSNTAPIEGKYILVVGSDFITFDDFSGRVLYNGVYVELSAECMEILETYI